MKDKEKESMEKEENICELVKQWVEKNHAQFKEGGNPQGKALYRENIFCMHA